MRGEYTKSDEPEEPKPELPPRARRILNAAKVVALVQGTTSACAENTFQTRGDDTARGNYLRVRGEYFSSSNAKVSFTELPPRARRILPKPLISPSPGGTTSACAENTRAIPAPSALTWNYLRVRGEYPK